MNKKIYRKEICINCANDKCTHNIKKNRVNTLSTMKCVDFIAKKRRNKKPLNWQKWQGVMRIGEIIKRKNKDTYKKLLTMKGAKYEKKMDKAKCRKLCK